MSYRRSIRAYASALGIVALFAWPGLRAQQLRPARIVAIGDIHGDYKAFKEILETTGLVDSSGAWSGGNAVLVQTGDYFDRGPDMRKLLDFLRGLESSAAPAGGTVHILLGNHDAMNLLGEVRDVNRAAYDAFAGDDAEKRRQRAFRDYIAIGDARERLLGSRPEPYKEKDRDKWLSEHPPGYIEYMAAMGADGDYGRWLRQRQAVLQIGGTIFLHAGIDPAAPPSSIAEINRTLASEIRKFDVARKYMVDHGLTLSFFSLKDTVEAARVEAAGLRGGQVTAPGPPPHRDDQYGPHYGHVPASDDRWAVVVSRVRYVDRRRGPSTDPGAAVSLRCTTICDRTFHPEDRANLRPVRRP